MGIGEAAFRVIPYLQWWQVVAVLATIVLIVVAIVQLVAVRRAIEAIPRDMQAIIVAATRQLVAEDKAREAEEALVKEFGKLSEIDRNYIEAYGGRRFRESREAKVPSGSEDYTSEEKEALRIYGPTVADQMRIERKSKAGKSGSSPSFPG